MAGALVDPNDLRRIGAGVRKIEELRLPAPATGRDRPLAGLMRVTLLEDLWSGESALAVRCKRVLDRTIFEVIVLGSPTDVGTYTLSLTHAGQTVASQPIPWQAEPHEVLDCLSPWGIGSGDLFVSGGSVDPQVVPVTMPPRSQLLITARVQLAFLGPFLADPPTLGVVSAMGGLSVAIVRPGRWVATQEIYTVVEAGLIGDAPSAFYQRLTPLVAGAGLLVGQSVDGEWLVTAAEARRYRQRAI